MKKKGKVKSGTNLEEGKVAFKLLREEPLSSGPVWMLPGGLNGSDLAPA